MSDLQIPERAVDAALAVNVTGFRPDSAQLFRLEAAAPIIMAAELRRLADEFYDGPQRWPASKVALLRDRAAELDPEGNTT